MNWNDLPPLSALRAFAAYVNTGSINKAGAALNVSHAAISQHIRSLETHLGVALFERSKRQLTLTPEGETLSRVVIEGFASMMQTCAALTGADAARPLQITTTPSFAASWLMPRLAGFREEHPNVSLMIDPTSQLCKIEPGGIDAAIRYGTGGWPGLDDFLLVDSPISVVAAPSLVGDLDLCNPSELRDFHWLHELGTNEASQWFDRQGIAQSPDVSFTAMPGNLLLDAARMGQGIAIIAEVFAKEDIAAGRLRLLSQDTTGKGYYLVTRPGVLRPPLKAFVSWLRREAKPRDKFAKSKPAS